MLHFLKTFFSSPGLSLVIFYLGMVNPVLAITLKNNFNGNFDQCLNLLHGSFLQSDQVKELLLNYQNQKANGKDLTSREKEKAIISILAELNNQDQLKPLLSVLIPEARKNEKFPVLPESDEQLVEAAYGLLDAELISRGLSKKYGKKFKFQSWISIKNELIRKINQSGISRGVKSAKFKKQLENLIGEKFTEGNHVTILNDGALANEKRTEIIRRYKTVHVRVWALYDDEAGRLYADLLKEKHKAGEEVLLMVDYLTSLRPGYGTLVKELEDFRVPVIRIKGSPNPYFGSHVKDIVGDGHLSTGEATGGSRNIGVVYLGMAPVGTPNWSDTDISFLGPAVRRVENLFRMQWNDQVDLQNLPYPKLPLLEIEQAEVGLAQYQSKSEGESMMVFDHIPGKPRTNPIMLTFFKSMLSARSTIDIANAYVLLNPAFVHFLETVLKEGKVAVRILSNSIESVDEPMIAVPIQISLLKLFKLGAKIYQQQGHLKTYHGKSYIIDRYLSAVESYNHHDSSHYYVAETSKIILGFKTAEKLTQDFEADLKMAKPMLSEADFAIPSSQLPLLLWKYFHNRY